MENFSRKDYGDENPGEKINGRMFYHYDKKPIEWYHKPTGT